MKQKVHVIFGAGPLGQALARELRESGESVRVVTRSGRADVPADVEVLQCNAADNKKTAEVCKGASIVYHCVGMPYAEWAEQWMPVMNGIIEGAIAAGAKLIYGDNLYAYGPFQGKLTENTPIRPTGPKTRIRAEAAELLLAAHRQGKVRAAIGRGPSFYGPGVRESAVGTRVFEHALIGKKAELLGNIDTKHSYIYIDDFARGLMILGERDEALGEVWHLPSAPAVTTREFVEKVYNETNTPLKTLVASKTIVSVMGLFNPFMRDLKETMHHFTYPFEVSHDKFNAAFGAEHVTPREEAVNRTLAWYRQSLAVK